MIRFVIPLFSLLLVSCIGNNSTSTSEILQLTRSLQKSLGSTHASYSTLLSQLETSIRTADSDLLDRVSAALKNVQSFLPDDQKIATQEVSVHAIEKQHQRLLQALAFHSVPKQDSVLEDGGIIPFSNVAFATQTTITLHAYFPSNMNRNVPIWEWCALQDVAPTDEKFNDDVPRPCYTLMYTSKAELEIVRTVWMAEESDETDEIEFHASPPTNEWLSLTVQRDLHSWRLFIDGSHAGATVAVFDDGEYHGPGCFGVGMVSQPTTGSCPTAAPSRKSDFLLARMWIHADALTTAEIGALAKNSACGSRGAHLYISPDMHFPESISTFPEWKDSADVFEASLNRLDQCPGNSQDWELVSATGDISGPQKCVAVGSTIYSFDIVETLFGGHRELEDYAPTLNTLTTYETVTGACRKHHIHIDRLNSDEPIVMEEPQQVLTHRGTVFVIDSHLRVYQMTSPDRFKQVCCEKKQPRPRVAFAAAVNSQGSIYIHGGLTVEATENSRSTISIKSSVFAFHPNSLGWEEVCGNGEWDRKAIDKGCPFAPIKGNRKGCTQRYNHAATFIDDNHMMVWGGCKVKKGDGACYANEGWPIVLEIPNPCGMPLKFWTDSCNDGRLDTQCTLTGGATPVEIFNAPKAPWTPKISIQCVDVTGLEGTDIEVFVGPSASPTKCGELQGSSYYESVRCGADLRHETGLAGVGVYFRSSEDVMFREITLWGRIDDNGVCPSATQELYYCPNVGCVENCETECGGRSPWPATRTCEKGKPPTLGQARWIPLWHPSNVVGDIVSPPPVTKPSPLSGFVSKLMAGGNWWVFHGGWTDGTTGNSKTWAFDIANNVWKEIDDESDVALGNACGAVVGSNLWLLGGQTDTEEASSEVWKLDVADPTRWH